LADILLFFAVGVCVLNYVLLWLFYRKFKFDYDKFAKRIQEIGLENELSDVFAPNSSQNDILRITNDLFNRIKRIYELQNVNSYTDLINNLKQNQGIDENLRNMLVDYFDTVTLISYRDHSISDAERAEIKSKLKLIIKMLPHEGGVLDEMKLDS
jgi:hypothetical protein